MIYGVGGRVDDLFHFFPCFEYAQEGKGRRKLYEASSCLGAFEIDFPCQVVTKLFLV